MENINKIPARDIDDMYLTITKMLDAPNPPFKQRFTHKKVEFGFIPNFENITSGEFIDLSSYIAKWADMHKAMAVMFRPIILRKGDKYLIEEYETSDTYAEHMKSLTMDRVLGAVFFLTNSLKSLIADLEIYLKEELATNQKLKDHLQAAGGGTIASISSVEGMFSTLRKLLG
jgi:hypothetical protein